MTAEPKQLVVTCPVCGATYEGISLTVCIAGCYSPDLDDSGPDPGDFKLAARSHRRRRLEGT